MVPETPPCEIMLDRDSSLLCVMSTQLIATQLIHVWIGRPSVCRVRGAGGAEWASFGWREVVR
jgi:hypothetical protein